MKSNKMIYNKSYPPMPNDPMNIVFRPRNPLDMEIGCSYQTTEGVVLRVIASKLSYYGNGEKISGYVEFRDGDNKLIRKDTDELKNLSLKIIFGYF